MEMTKTCLLAALALCFLARSCLSVPLQETDLSEVEDDYPILEEVPLYTSELREKRDAESSDDSDADSTSGLLKRLRRYVQIHVLRENHMRNHRRRHNRRHRRPYNGNYRRYQVSNS